MNNIPMPPLELIELTTGMKHSDIFMSTGINSKNDIETALALHGLRLDQFKKVLDFGVGCGRVARHLTEIPNLVGVDILKGNIDFLSENMPFETWVLNEEYPPLPFPDNEFELIINHSVFTHLDVSHQDAWLQELVRILKPGGFLILTFAGLGPFRFYLENLREHGAENRAMIHEQDFLHDGYKWITEDNWRRSKFPDWYHSMFHSPTYVLEHWSKFFEVLSWKQSGSLNFQDNVV